MIRITLPLASMIALSACTTAMPASERAMAPIVVATPTEPAANTELASFFESYEDRRLALNPESKAYRGIIDADYGRFDPYSDDNRHAQRKLKRDAVAEMRERFDYDSLNAQDKLSYRLFVMDLADMEKMVPYEDHGFIFSQRGQQSGLPAFLINIHRVGEPAHAEAYISRIADLGRVIRNRTAESKKRAAEGIMPPDWAYPYVLDDIDNLLGAGMDNAVLEDFRAKVTGLDIDDAARVDFIQRAEAAWANEAIPAYQALRIEMLRQQKLAPADDGVWRLPDGDNYYKVRLANYTNSDMTPDEVHQLGLANMDRIHGEMRAIMKQVGFTGTLNEFFDYVRTDPKFFPKTREEYLTKVDAVLTRMNAALPDYFGILPKDPLVVKPVEAFREKSAGLAFYSSPAPDGSRPGTYYINLYDFSQTSLNDLEALAFHEGNPGHHLQRSIQTGLDGLPAFRRFGGWTAYTEGWGLYSEELGKDMGFYEDPYSDFGRLSMELWRAARLVVDTGLHQKRWSREKAIDYLMQNTPNSEGDAVKAIERYLVYPGQATAYLVGKLKIMELREFAKAELGDKFDYREFHDMVLAAGPRPLDILDEDVRAWVAANKE